MLHLALPALEALHKAWSTWLTREKYSKFRPALEAGLLKIGEYYDWTSDSNMYTFAMCCILLLSVVFVTDRILVVLDPSQKTDHICKHWGANKLEDILQRTEKIVCHFIHMEG